MAFSSRVVSLRAGNLLMLTLSVGPDVGHTMGRLESFSGEGDPFAAALAPSAKGSMLAI